MGRRGSILALCGLTALALPLVLLPIGRLRAGTATPPVVSSTEYIDLGPEHIVPPDVPQQDDVDRLLSELQAQRTQGGQLPVPTQIAALATALGKSYEEVESESNVVVTLKVPLPWDMASARDRLPPGIDVTAYLELDDGYPFTASGRTAHAAAGSLRSYLEHIEAMLDDVSAVPTPGPTEQAVPVVGLNSALLRAASDEFTERVVLLGLRMTTSRFQDDEVRLRQRLPIHAVEVQLDDSLVPFRAWSGKLTKARLEEFRRHWSSPGLGAPLVQEVPA